MNNIFDLINADLFSALTGVDRRNNYLLLKRIYTYFDEGNFKSYVYKEELVQHLITFLRQNKIKIKEDDNDESSSVRAYREYVLERLRYFKNTGWLYEEVDNRWQSIIGLYDSSLHIIATLSEVANLDSSSVEQSGYIYSIYSNLKSLRFADENCIMILEQVKQNAQDLRKSLIGLNSNIKRYIDKMMNDKTLSPNDVLTMLFDEYHHKVIVKSFNNLKTKDHPDKYAKTITETLYRLVHEDLEQLTTNYVAVKQIVNPSETDLREIKEMLTKMIYEVINTFEGINGAIEDIETQNMKFLIATKARLSYLVKQDINLEGRINETLKKIEKVSDKFAFSDVINLTDFGQVDEYSLYLPRKTRTLNFDDREPLNEVSPEDFARARQENALFSEFNKKAIFAFGARLLEQADEININEISVAENKLVFKLLLLKTYQYDENCGYQIIEKDEKIMLEGIELQNFIIRRKEDAYGL